MKKEPNNAHITSKCLIKTAQGGSKLDTQQRNATQRSPTIIRWKRGGHCLTPGRHCSSSSAHLFFSPATRRC